MVDTMKKQVTTENHSKDFHDDSTLSPEMILREDEPVAPNARLAQEIIKNGIQCEAIKEIGSLPVEREPYYRATFSLLLPGLLQIEVALHSISTAREIST